MRKLVICEKRSSASRISFMLSDGEAKREYINKIPVWTFERDGDSYSVMGLRGHIVALDYPEEYNQWDKVELKTLAVTEPEKKVLVPSIVKTARDVLEGVDEIIIATDYDREGELIGVEVLEAMGESVSDRPKKRARFSALTKFEIERAFSDLSEIDFQLAQSAESRQMIDLAWGASLTRFLSLATNRLGREYLSVGRVQSPTLALIVDREKEIKDFVPQPFWELIAEFEKDIVFYANHTNGRFWVEKEAERIYKIVQSAKSGTVKDYFTKEERKRPPPPFDTTSFLTEPNKIGFSASRAMRVAESLYTEGWISYPRTDNTVYPKTLSLKRILEKLKDSALSKEAKEILKQEKLTPTRGRKFSTDHPPIHPVAGAKKTKLKGDKWKVYELVVRRFLATLAPDAILLVSEATMDVKGEEFKAEGTTVTEKGGLKYYPYREIKETELPELLQEENVRLNEVEMKKDETKPPFRFSQGFLIQEMEKLGLGTKSTRHEIIRKLIQRKYIYGKYLTPTDSGIAVINALEEHANQITKPDMTSTLEEDMLGISKGDKTLKDVVAESQEMLLDTLDTLQANEKAIGEEITEALKKQNRIGECKECGGDLLILRSRKGNRFIGCSSYPECNVTHPLPQGGIVIPIDEVCEECGSPKVRMIASGRSEDICVDSECVTSKKRTLMGECKKCGGDLVLRHSARGKRFLGCSSYPKCTETHSLPQTGLIQPTDLDCKSCGHNVIKVIKKGRKPWLLCINSDCPSKKK
ncbi:MAG: DNA topoisomerase I [Methanobacteriota archaeon]|nr:MAG: DNA topoisomerase I [Euryarchaeota archaeon]